MTGHEILLLVIGAVVVYWAGILTAFIIADRIMIKPLLKLNEEMSDGWSRTIELAQKAIDLSKPE